MRGHRHIGIQLALLTALGGGLSLPAWAGTRTITVQGTVSSDTRTVAVNGQAATLTASAAVLAFTAPVILQEGPNTIAVTASDRAANASTTAIQVTLDTMAPMITGVTVSQITSRSAIIAWQASEPSSGVVEYGPTTSYGQTASSPTTAGTSHTGSLANLSAQTTYHYRVMSTDRAGNRAPSADLTFTTTAAGTNASPVITSFTATPSTITPGQVSALRWMSVDATGCTVSGGVVVAAIQPSSGSLPVSPTTTTTYTLRCTDAAGMAASASVTVTVSAGTGVNF